MSEAHTSRDDLARAILQETDADPIEAEAERIARQRELNRERDAVKAIAGERSFRAFLEHLVSETAQTFGPPPTYRTPRAPRHATQETMVQMLSDFHAYEIVSSARTRGINEYNALEFGHRARRIVESHISIKRKLEQGGWRFNRLVVGANGDLVSGTIHEVERHSDAPNIVLAVYGAGLVLAQMLRDLAAEYPSVEVFCTAGNHGRLPDARRVQQKDPTRSWDTLIYLFAREHLRDVKRVKFYIPDSYSIIFDVGRWRFLQTHGHDIRSWNSIPYYGINRMTANLNALEASRGSLVHYWLLGHFHSLSAIPSSAGEVFINGSLIGGTEFSVHGMGKADKPMQMMFGVHDEHGVTHRWPLLALGDVQQPYDVRPWEAV